MILQLVHRDCKGYHVLPVIVQPIPNGDRTDHHDELRSWLGSWLGLGDATHLLRNKRCARFTVVVLRCCHGVCTAKCHAGVIQLAVATSQWWMTRSRQEDAQHQILGHESCIFGNRGHGGLIYLDGLLVLVLPCLGWPIIFATKFFFDTSNQWLMHNSCLFINWLLSPYCYPILMDITPIKPPIIILMAIGSCFAHNCEVLYVVFSFSLRRSGLVRRCSMPSWS